MTLQEKKVIHAGLGSLRASTRTAWVSGDLKHWVAYANKMKQAIATFDDMMMGLTSVVEENKEILTSEDILEKNTKKDE